MADPTSDEIAELIARYFDEFNDKTREFATLLLYRSDGDDDVGNALDPAIEMFQRFGFPFHHAFIAAMALTQAGTLAGFVHKSWEAVMGAAVASGAIATPGVWTAEDSAAIWQEAMAGLAATNQRPGTTP